MPVYACHISVSCHVSPEAKLRMLYLMDITRHSDEKMVYSCFMEREEKRGENVNIFRKIV